jgi:ABC-type amino acid transport system permease subunit
LWVTIWISFVSGLVGLLIGLITGLCRLSPNPALARSGGVLYRADPRHAAAGADFYLLFLHRHGA